MKKMIRLLILTLILFPLVTRGEPFIVKDGIPQASIIISETPQRTTRMAAKGLADYVEKISGARLPVGTEPSPDYPNQIFVGNSAFTEKWGIKTDDLKDGAYRIASDENRLVLIGDDTDFVPVEPWPRSNTDIASGKMQEEWNKITGKEWGYTHSQLHKHYSGSNSLFGTPEEQIYDKDGNVNVWTYDERGSFNAVCGFLRSLGVRWYMPGEVGEIVPEMATIPFPAKDKTVRPDFPMRILNFRASVYGHDAMMWGFRLGLRQPWGRQAAHGLDRMTHNEATLKNHPDWFALYGGKRHNEPGKRLNQLCYSNEELFEEAVSFARAQFDHYDMDVVSIMPPDGYTAMCQCNLCEGKDTPDRGYRGGLSDYVWDFVNRVAKEVGKTHPDKLISNCAYGIYTDPPLKIEKLEPNVQVIIVGGRRPTSEDREGLRKLREGWAELTDLPIEIFENYPFTARGFYLPAYIPKVLGESISELKGKARGEDIWLSMDFSDKAIGFNHFLIYFTARMYWGGESTEGQALFDEYCEKFYGPVAGEMKTFFDYCQDHWREMEADGGKGNQALALFAAAKKEAPADSVYADRIALIDRYLDGLRSKSELLSQKRGPVPNLRLVGGEPLEPIVIDGKLDDKAWRDIATASTGRMRELQTGRLPVYNTEIKAVWQRGALHFAIRCEEEPGEELNIATEKREDQAIWYGDAVEFLINTDAHNYYQIVVNPAGAVVDIDRGASRDQWFRWDAKAEVATQVADDHWTIEIRLPVVQDENDPLHLMIGRKPTLSLPWHINICRQRIRKNASEFSAFSPTGTKGFHEPMKFAHFFGGNSHQFKADETVTDYLLADRAAEQLARERNWNEAKKAYLEMAAAKDVTDFQKSDALAKAARCARNVKDHENAAEIVERIPLSSVAKTVRMENLLAKREWAQLVEQFGEEDIRQWPFWQQGAGAFVRGRAFVFTKAGERADKDLQLALKYTPDRRIRSSILATMGSNREMVLNDDSGALEAYRENFEHLEKIGGAEEYRSVQGAARILARQKKFDEAIATIHRIDLDKTKGYWRDTSLVVLGDVLTAAGKSEEAKEMYQKVLDSEKVDSNSKRAAQEALGK